MPDTAEETPKSERQIPEDVALANRRNEALKYADGSDVAVGDTVSFHHREVARPRFSDAEASFTTAAPNADADALTFTVVMVNDPDEHPGYPVAIEAEQSFEGCHDCEGAVASGNGWWALGSELEKR
jgi:hypothetical protein